MVRYAGRSPAIRGVLGDLVLGDQGYVGLKRRRLWALPGFLVEATWSDCAKAFAPSQGDLVIPSSPAWPGDQGIRSLSAAAEGGLPESPSGDWRMPSSGVSSTSPPTMACATSIRSKWVAVEVRQLRDVEG